MNIFLLSVILVLHAYALPSGRFLQFTDLHYDAEYAVGSAANCWLEETGLTCCRSSSIPKQPYREAGIFGDFNCDTPKQFLEATFQWIRDHLSQPDFILW